MGPACQREMATATGCSVTSVHVGGTTYLRTRVGDEAIAGKGDDAFRCGDCGAHGDHFHHLGCDLERCPRCQG